MPFPASSARHSLRSHRRSGVAKHKRHELGSRRGWRKNRQHRRGKSLSGGMGFGFLGPVLNATFEIAANVTDMAMNYAVGGDASASASAADSTALVPFGEAAAMGTDAASWSSAVAQWSTALVVRAGNAVATLTSAVTPADGEESIGVGTVAAIGAASIIGLAAAYYYGSGSAEEAGAAPAAPAAPAAAARMASMKDIVTALATGSPEAQGQARAEMRFMFNANPKMFAAFVLNREAFPRDDKEAYEVLVVNPPNVLTIEEYVSLLVQAGTLRNNAEAERYTHYLKSDDATFLPDGKLADTRDSSVPAAIVAATAEAVAEVTVATDAVHAAHKAVAAATAEVAAAAATPAAAVAATTAAVAAVVATPAAPARPRASVFHDGTEWSDKPFGLPVRLGPSTPATNVWMDEDDVAVRPSPRPATRMDSTLSLMDDGPVSREDVSESQLAAIRLPSRSGSLIPVREYGVNKSRLEAAAARKAVTDAAAARKKEAGFAAQLKSSAAALRVASLAAASAKLSALVAKEDKLVAADAAAAVVEAKKDAQLATAHVAAVTAVAPEVAAATVAAAAPPAPTVVHDIKVAEAVAKAEVVAATSDAAAANTEADLAATIAAIKARWSAVTRAIAEGNLPDKAKRLREAIAAKQLEIAKAQEKAAAKVLDVKSAAAETIIKNEAAPPTVAEAVTSAVATVANAITSIVATPAPLPPLPAPVVPASMLLTNEVAVHPSKPFPAPSSQSRLMLTDGTVDSIRTLPTVVASPAMSLGEARAKAKAEVEASARRRVAALQARVAALQAVGAPPAVVAAAVKEEQAKLRQRHPSLFTWRTSGRVSGRRRSPAAPKRRSSPRRKTSGSGKRRSPSRKVVKRRSSSLKRRSSGSGKRRSPSRKVVKRRSSSLKRRSSGSRSPPKRRTSGKRSSPKRPSAAGARSSAQRKKMLKEKEMMGKLRRSLTSSIAKAQRKRAEEILRA